MHECMHTAWLKFVAHLSLVSCDDAAVAKVGVLG